MAHTTFFGRLFNSNHTPVGIKAEDSSVDISKNIEKLRNTMDLLDKKISYNERRIDKLKEQALEHKKKNNKTQAIRCLRQKKNLEKMQENLDNQYANLEYQLVQLENLNTNKEVVLTMKSVDNTIKDFEKKINVDKIDTLQDDLQESIQTANEITSAISQPLNPMYANNDELEAELDEMDNEREQEEFDKKLLEINDSTILLPEVPTQPLPKIKSKDEDEAERELRELVAEMS